jgi:G3E family GTPase
LAKAGRFDYLLIESSGISEPMPVAETFTFTDETGKSLSDLARLDTMVTVVDGHNFLRDYGSNDTLVDRQIGLSEEDERDVVDLLVDQIEFADVLIISKVDLLSPHELGQLSAILRHMNPTARILSAHHGQVPLESILNTGLFSMAQAETSSQWLKEARGTHVPETTEYGISSFIYRARRPFHPARLAALFEDDWPALRSKGFFWLATRNDWLGVWSQAGNIFNLEPGGQFWATVPRTEWPTDPAGLAQIQALWQSEHGDRRQELVFIGCDMDEAALRAKLDACLLNDAEMRLGASRWATFADPFPP